MSSAYIFILIPMLCYAAQGVVNFVQGDKPHALIWFSYACGNVGFLWYEMTKQ